MASRRIVLACLTPRPDGEELGRLELPSYGVRRIQAAVVGDPERPAHIVELIDLGRDDVAGYAREILAFEPEIVGFSIYVWSTACLIDVAREIRRRRPGCLIVFGGPSARRALFDLDAYRDPARYLDAIVEGDGEAIFREMADLPELTRETLATVPGATVRAAAGWRKIPNRVAAADLNQIPSPFQIGLCAPNEVAYVESYRGCPLSCRFCEWGASDKFKSTFSVDYLTRELQAFQALRPPAVFLLDAGLNLNLQAFRNLREANRRTGALSEALFWAEIYPSVVRDEHFEFLGEIGPAYLGVGMQSMDPEVLRLHQRPSDSPRFERIVRELAAITNIELQIIFGLPGDTPEGFRRTLGYALSLPASVRVYHCLVLPDALMTRALPEWNVEFHPVDLAMKSCLGWSADAIGAMREELDRAARRAGGNSGRFWWSFPRSLGPGVTAVPA